MLSIFEQKDFEQQPERKLTLNRLQNVLGTPAVKGEQPTRLAVAVEESGAAAKPALAPVGIADRKNTLPPPPDSLAPPAVSAAELRAPHQAEREPMPVAVPMVAERDEVAVPQELNQFAEQFTRGFREVLVNTVRDLQGPMVEDRRKLDTTLDSVTRTAEDLEVLTDELGQTCQRIDSLGKAVQELMARVGKLEDSVNITNAATHAIQDAQQAIEKRFELQAGIIRSLNNSMQAREDRLDKLFGAFQAVQGVAAERPGRRSSSLPDNL
jgi:hypothetical protein